MDRRTIIIEGRICEAIRKLTAEEVMLKYLAWLAVLEVVFIAYFFLHGAPITDLLNQKFQPISVDQQRQKSIGSSATALKSIPSANVAAVIDVKTIVALAGPLLKSQGVLAIRIKGDQQLLKMEADFQRVFGPDDVPADFTGRDLILALKPDIRGTISLSMGIAVQRLINPHPRCS
jgi:hypothetical protein